MQTPSDPAHPPKKIARVACLGNLPPTSRAIDNSRPPFFYYSLGLRTVDDMIALRTHALHTSSFVCQVKLCVKGGKHFAIKVPPTPQTCTDYSPGLSFRPPPFGGDAKEAAKEALLHVAMCSLFTQHSTSALIDLCGFAFQL